MSTFIVLNLCISCFAISNSCSLTWYNKYKSSYLSLHEFISRSNDSLSFINSSILSFLEWINIFNLLHSAFSDINLFSFVSICNFNVFVFFFSDFNLFLIFSISFIKLLQLYFDSVATLIVDPVIEFISYWCCNWFLTKFNSFINFLFSNCNSFINKYLH